MRYLYSILLAAALSGSVARADIVLGTSDPWLAGMQAGAVASSGDVAPDESPMQASLTPVPGTSLQFAVTGSVNNSPGPSGLPPDGGSTYPHFAGDENGMSGVIAPINALMGVFLGAGQPDATPAPVDMNFDAPSSIDFLSLSPELKQVFFIGDGLDFAADVQSFVVPTGATRLYLGTMDGFGWYNNEGAFNVTVSPAGAPNVPEPGSLALLGIGLTGLAGLRRRKL